MAFSTTITHLIIFIGAVVAAYILASTLFSSIQDLMNSFALQKSELSERLGTIFEIESVCKNISVLEIYLKNVGFESMSAEKDKYDVFINGVKYNVTNSTLVVDKNSNGIFDPEDVLKLTVDVNLPENSVYRIKVVYSNGANKEDEIYLITCG